jgi:hypothetical protein
MSGYPCESCHGEAVRSWWFDGTLGQTAVWACSEPCAAAAMRKHGGKRFKVLPPAKGVLPKGAS